jgi:hypothetical protein
MEVPVGSTLISSPVAAASGNYVHVLGVGPDHGLYHWVYTSAAPFGSPKELVGVNFWSTPAALTGPNQIDLFGLGPNKGMLHTRWNGSKWSDWDEQPACCAAQHCRVRHFRIAISWCTTRTGNRVPRRLVAEVCWVNLRRHPLRRPSD